MARIEARRTGTKLTLMRVFGLVLVGIMTGRLTVGGPMDSTLASYGLLSSNDDGSSQNDAKRGTKEGGESSMLRSGGDAVADCNDEIEKAKKQERNKVIQLKFKNTWLHLKKRKENTWRLKLNPLKKMSSFSV